MRTVTRTAAAGLVVAALALAGCGSDGEDTTSDATTTTEATTTTAAVATEVVIEEAWARQSPSGTTMGAIYLNITSPEDDQLVKAAVPTEVAAETQIHETVAAEEGDMSTTTMAGSDMSTTTMAEGDAGATSTTMAGSGGMGSMTMREVEAIELPAGEMVELAPGGYHIMLIDLVKPLVAGETIELTLTFEKAADRKVVVEVREG